MKIDFALIQIALIFFPGIIWAAIDAKFAAKTKPSSTQFIVNAFIFGIIAYVVLFAVYSALEIDHPLKAMANKSRATAVSAVTVRDVFLTTAIALVLSVLWLYTEQYKLVARFLQTIRATKKYGDEDVWDFTFNSSNPAVEYIHLRDFKNALVYAGWVNTFSESGRLRELVLRDVQVYNFDGSELMELPMIYLAFDPSDVHIEFPYEQTGGNPQ